VPESEKESSVPFKLPERLPAAVMHWLRGFLAGLFAAAMASPEQRRERQLVRWADDWREWVQRLVDSAVALPEDDPDTLFPLRAALIGRARTEILVVLGPPPATSVPEPSKPKLNAPPYLTAESWYYPLDLKKHLAIAVTFVNDLVSSVDRIPGPPAA
jgi:AcrR family transcriptional regulator